MLAHPERVDPDPDPQLEHRLARIDECGGRVLRVVVNRTELPLRVVTAYLDFHFHTTPRKLLPAAD